MNGLHWKNLKSLIEDRGLKNFDKSFLLYENRIITYKEVNDASNIIAHNLREFGIKKGDNILVFLFNCPEYIMIWFALIKLGAIMVPINTASRRNDLLHVINDSEAKTIILETDLLKNYLEVRNEVKITTEIILSPEPLTPMKGFIDFSNLLKGQAEALDTPIDMSDPACIIYTSGTTGRPKGVILPHFCYMNSGMLSVQNKEIKQGDRIYTTLPLFHIGAQQLAVVTAMVAGIDFALARRFSASKFWDEVRKYNCNYVHYLGALAQILYRQEEKPDDADNPAEIMFGGGMTKDLWEKFEKRFGVTILEGYAVTECGCSTLYHPIGCKKVGTIGTPTKNVRVEVVNENDEILPPNTQGELVIRPQTPFSMMLGYYKDPASTWAVCRNLWYHTGDIVYKDEEGFFYFIGRQSYFMRRRGENVSADEVEEVINSHPEVQNSAVVGVFSEVGDDEIKAYIVPKKDISIAPESIISWCEERIAYFKVPRYIEFVNDLPMTPTNRIQRFILKNRGIGVAWDREKYGYKQKGK